VPEQPIVAIGSQEYGSWKVCAQVENEPVQPDIPLLATAHELFDLVLAQLPYPPTIASLSLRICGLAADQAAHMAKLYINTNDKGRFI
jgi:hypothetical protein